MLQITSYKVHKPFTSPFGLTLPVLYKPQDKVTSLPCKPSFHPVPNILSHSTLQLFFQNVAKGTMNKRPKNDCFQHFPFDNHLPLPFLLKQKVLSMWEIVSLRKTHLYTVISRITGCIEYKITNPLKKLQNNV